MSRVAAGIVIASVVTWACGAETSVETEGVGGLINGGGAMGGWPSTTTTHTTTTTTSDTGGAGAMGGFGGDCVDIGLGEPNESEDTAYPLKSDAIDDCDSSGGAITGTIEGDSDVEWFTYDGNDKLGCVVNPTVSLSASDNVRICMFFECFNGDTSFGCPSGTNSVVSTGMRDGCCGSASFTVDDLDCGGSSDEYARVLISIEDPNADALTCIDWDLDYHY